MNRTKIDWVKGMTWNPMVGCSPASEGCANCYAKAMAMRFVGFFEPQFYSERLPEPWYRRKPTNIFAGSMTDIFHTAFDKQRIFAVLDVIQRCPQHTFVILTKRADRMLDIMGDFYDCYEASSVLNIPPLPNLYLGVSVENAAHVDRIPILLDILAAKHIVSFEPLIGDVGDISEWLVSREEIAPYSSPTNPEWRRIPALNWCIVGVETGPGARPMDYAWARDIRDQCAAANVPFWFKSGKQPIPEDLNIKQTILS